MASTEYELLRKHHNHEEVRENQCSSYLVKRIKAPVDLVRSLVRRFDEGDLKIGGVREVNLRSGFRTTTSSERLEILEDEERVFSIRIVGVDVGGDNRMKNYTSIVTVHPEMIDGGPGTLVVESYVVDVADGKIKEETCEFVESLIKYNLKSLADVSESWL